MAPWRDILSEELDSYTLIFILEWLKLFKEKKICHDHKSCSPSLTPWGNILGSLRLRFQMLLLWNIGVL